MTDIVTPAEVSTFWFQTLTPKDWYTADDAVDDQIRAQFRATWDAAHAGGLQDWLTSADDLLAYLIVTDQFPRNMFRGDGRSFATDALALAATDIALDRGWDMAIDPPARQFFYLPLMHAEDLSLQDRAITLFSERMPKGGEDNLDHAKAHRWIIAEFGRFPYRNVALERVTTEAEQAFLDAGGYRIALENVRA